jgi:hypothetical protein
VGVKEAVFTIPEGAFYAINFLSTQLHQQHTPSLSLGLELNTILISAKPQLFNRVKSMTWS